jgi:cytochrome c553
MSRTFEGQPSNCTLGILSFALAASLLLGTTGGASNLPASLVGNVAAGKKLATQGGETAFRCYVCHGYNGEGRHTRQFDYPRLAGSSELYLRKQLLDYRSGSRPSRTMQGLASRISPQQLADVAAYYASCSTTDAAIPVSTNIVAFVRGQSLANRGDANRQILSCVTCHGYGKTDTEAMVPPLAGQPTAYLQSQLCAWKEGLRTNDAGGVMRAVAQKLEDSDIAAAAEYYSHTRPPAQ